MACNKDDNTADTSLENVTEVNFNITLFIQNDTGELLSYDIISGNELIGPVNLSSQPGFPLFAGYNIDGNHIVFFDRFQEARSWKKNVVTGEVETFEYYFIPPNPATSVRYYATKDYLLAYYQNFSGANPQDLYLNIFEIATGGKQTIFFTDQDYNPDNSLTRFAYGNKLMGIFQNEAGVLQMKIVNLESPNENYTININDRRDYTAVGNEIFLFGDDDYRIFDIGSGQLGPVIPTVETITTPTPFFKTNRLGNTLSYEFPYAQPSQISRGPALYNLDTGLRELFDLDQFRLNLQEESQYLAGADFSYVKQEDGVIILSYSYSTEQSGLEYGIAFLNYQMEVISTVRLPYPAFNMIVHE
jgi:hypothetical protein